METVLKKIKLHSQCLDELFSMGLSVPCQITQRNFFLADITFGLGLVGLSVPCQITHRNFFLADITFGLGLGLVNILNVLHQIMFPHLLTTMATLNSYIIVNSPFMMKQMPFSNSLTTLLTFNFVRANFSSFSLFVNVMNISYFSTI